MSGSSKASYENNRQTVDQNSNSASTGTGAYDKTIVTDPRTNSTIDSLTGSLADTGKASGSATAFLNSMVGGQNNPYAEQLVQANNKLADAEFKQRLAGIRSGGYGGGMGRDLLDQGIFTGNFTSQQNANNVKTLLDAFNTNQANGLNAAGQLSGIDANKYQAALQLISTLRGEKGTNDQSTNTETSSRAVTKENKGSTSLEAGFKI